ncbi:flavodoxin [Tuberibacillus calidus]|jgi:predicted ribonucleotide reductase-associated flavodoxin|uniref:flavodoxin n=1 Tax=Tuberibacillus calidus TaxID=340097 RepID=UPI000421007E|nr:flavodoxin [Tuberibacillus calidus]
MVRVLICYASYSGNTEEVAEGIQKRLLEMGMDGDLYRIRPRLTDLPNPSEYDAFVIGSFTWVKGSTPKLVKDFVAKLGIKPHPVFVFGTGDTQFGGDGLFCRAADKLARFYASPFPPLKIEQSPRGDQEMIVDEWTKGVADYCRQNLIVSAS